MIRLFRATDFRCLESVELELDSRMNLIVGTNGSGKTSLLEALAYLGRGKSFRGASTSALLRHGTAEFVLFGEVEGEGPSCAVGVRNSKDGLEIRVAGEAVSGAAALASILPLQVIDPEVHNLIAGGPEQRRRFLDWIAFHVEHGHLETWRRFRRVLKQRNAALKAGSSLATIRSWNVEFLEQSASLSLSRKRALDRCRESLVERGDALLQTQLAFEYQEGWGRARDLGAALEQSLVRDQQLGATQLGPHRADLKVSYDERKARKLVSRGQQKLLASAMILAAVETAQVAMERPMLLLLDDPAAELDSASIRYLMDSVQTLGCQIVATSLEPKALGLGDAPKMFHVEHGRVRQE
jgi:DNA replication and repair protein RecF